MSSTKTTKKESKTLATGGSPSAAEENAAKYPDMSLAQRVHRLGLTDGTTPEDLLKEIADMKNVYLYRKVLNKCKELGLSASTSVLSEDDLKAVEAEHKTKMEELEKEVETAAENAGDMEVLEARLAIARYAAQCLDPTAALAAYQQVMDLPKLSTGKKMDVWMESARIAFFYNLKGPKTSPEYFIEQAEKLSEKGGGDWDRRNRLKVYRSLAKLWHRDIATAAPLLLEGMATFSCNELCSYADFLIYAMLANLLHLERPAVHEKILEGPEILAVQHDIPVVIKLVKSLYDCDYKKYLHALVESETLLQGDRFLAPHAQYWMRELHILAYHQFLESYSSVQLSAMADAMGVSVEFLDHHASRYIAAGRLSAKIDKYGGVIRTARPDATNAQYREVIQKGDLLLNRIQTLARVVDL